MKKNAPDNAFLSDVKSEVSSSFGPYQERVLRLLAYFDIFDYPLLYQEIETLGCGPHDAILHFDDALNELLQHGWIQRSGDFFHLSSRAHLVPIRLKKEKDSQRLWQEVPTSAKVLAKFPFVRSVLVTGSLSKSSAGPDADVDFLLITAPERVWICRSTVALFRKILPEYFRKYFCANVFMSSNHLRYDQHNMYIAVEIATAIPVINPSLGRQLFELNAWIQSYLPGTWLPRWMPPKELGLPMDCRNEGAWFERLLEGKSGDWLERSSRILWAAFWKAKYPMLKDSLFADHFRIEPHLSTNHFHNFQPKTLEAYRKRLERYGLPVEPVR